ncbi:hypothetical protein L7F22_008112 [Adiantum nelumboides]|nr:hypothetical protein [Adiantum nelumboides]
MFNVKASMHEEVFWRTRLSAAFRTAVGCILAGLILQLGNMHVKWATFPIFAYVMAVTVVGESTFGKALQDTTAVFMGTVQGIGMGMLVLQVVGTHRITLSVAIACISLSSFIIVYPPKTHIVSKRVALAHSAILYVTASIKQGDMDALRFPLQLAGTTMVGAISGMFALLLPFPHFAMCQVQSQAKLSTRIIAERLKLMVNSFCGDDVTKGLSLSLQARSLAKIGSTVDAEVVSKESDLGWEFPGFSEHLKHLMKGLKSLKADLVGMESGLKVDLNSASSRRLHCVLKDCLVHLTDWACLALRHASESGLKGFSHLQLLEEEGREALASFHEKLSLARQKLAYLNVQGENIPDASLGKNVDEVFLHMKKSFQFSSEALFFLFNLQSFIKATGEMLQLSKGFMFGHARKLEKSTYDHLCDVVQSHLPHLLHDQNSSQLKIYNCSECKFCSKSSNFSEQSQQKRPTFWWRKINCSVKNKLLSSHCRTAFKMSLAMGLGAFLGSWFDKSKGYWADITLGLGFAGIAKGGSFKIASLRAQGTVAGSIYGLLVVLATKDFPSLRLIALIPWVILTSFLRQSKLYGFSGAMSAFTGAVVILARTNKDSSDESFTVVRIVEAFMGMASFIVVELLVMPRRAAGMVKIELVSALSAMRSHMAAALLMFSELRCQKCCALAVVNLKLQETTLRRSLARVQKLAKEATEEPQLWYSAFPANAYTKLMESQGRMVDMLHFGVCAFDIVVQTMSKADTGIQELHGTFDRTLYVLKESVLPLLEFLEEALQSNNITRMSDRKSPCNLSNRDERRAGDDEKLVEQENTAHFARSGRLLLRMGSMKSNYFMEEFEKSYQVLTNVLLRSCVDEVRENYMEEFSNSLLLSLGALAFSLEGLLREASELEQAVHELLQLESPWNLIELWNSPGPPHMRREGSQTHGDHL